MYGATQGHTQMVFRTSLFGGYQSFLWGHWYSHFGLLHWFSKPGWISLLACFITCMQQNPQIHLWCDTCWPLDGQHGSWAIPIYVLVNKHWWGLIRRSIMPMLHSGRQRQRLYRLTYADSAYSVHVCTLCGLEMVVYQNVTPGFDF